MSTIVDILRRDPEPLPAWLDTDGPPAFDRRNFFGSRTVYYPGSGGDGQPVKLCALSHAAHSFIYVDYGVGWITISGWLHDPQRQFRGYAITHQEDVPEHVLRPGGWTAHVLQGEAANSGRFRRSFVKPYARLIVLDRQGDDDDHGPRRLAILFIGGDGIASYDALYCQGDGTPPPFLALVQDYFGRYRDRFDKDSVLERIVRRSHVQPEFLLVGRGSRPWRGYVDTGALADPGGQNGRPRRLFRRSQDCLSDC